MQPSQMEPNLLSPSVCQYSSSFLYPRVTQPMARDHVVWSLFSFTTFNCCCLGLLALLFSIKSRDRKVIGDPEGAANYGRTAKYLNVAALTVTTIIFIIVIIILISSAMFIISVIFEIMKLPDEVEEFQGN